MRLNDLFGIQARGGCACAGPYGQRLLGLDAATAKAFDEARGFGQIEKGTLRALMSQKKAELKWMYRYLIDWLFWKKWDDICLIWSYKFVIICICLRISFWKGWNRSMEWLGSWRQGFDAFSTRSASAWQLGQIGTRCFCRCPHVKIC